MAHRVGKVVAALTLAALPLATSAAAQQPGTLLEVVQVPLPSAPAQILELRSRDQQMGGQPPKEIVEGALSLDGRELFSVASRSAAAAVVPVLGEATLYIVKVNFTLHQLAERTYREVTLRATLSSPGAEVLDLYPKQLADADDVARTLAVTSALGLLGVADPSGVIPVDDLKPVVRGYRQRQREVYWVFSGTDGGGVAPGTRSVYLLIKVPRTATRISGALFGEAKIEVRFINLPWQREARTEKGSFSVPLRQQPAEAGR